MMQEISNDFLEENEESINFYRTQNNLFVNDNNNNGNDDEEK